jgi:hypothetical protein
MMAGPVRSLLDLVALTPGDLALVAIGGAIPPTIVGLVLRHQSARTEA